jgi:formylglycine-generating enzyme required for sulfatase activity/serine/threonine protein kinase
MEVEVEWQLDEDTINLLSGTEVDLSLGSDVDFSPDPPEARSSEPQEDLSPSSTQAQSEQREVDPVEAQDSASAAQVISNSDRQTVPVSSRTEPHEPQELTPDLFLKDLREFETSEPSEPLLGGVRDFSDESAENKSGDVQGAQRGQVIWSKVAEDIQEVELSHRSIADQGSKSAHGRRGWLLDRLQNKIEGAETWVAVEVNEAGQGDRLAVVKLVWPHVLSDNPMMWQFDAEIQVRALQQVRHQSVPEILAWGEYTELNAWFTVIEWVEGNSLAYHLKRGALNVDDAIGLFSPLAEGLALCHREGLIHRKIQPAHIIISPKGPSLISFQWVEEVAGKDIQRGQQGAYQLFGQRPKFLAPEWMQDALITDAADIYALGACLLEAVNPQAKGWREAPRQLKACLAGSLHAHPNERSEIKGFIQDLKLSSVRYHYQANRDTGVQAESLLLHEVVDRIRHSELEWHMLAHQTDQSQSGTIKLAPWGELSEVVNALDRAKRYQSELEEQGLNHDQSHDLELRKEDLDRRAESISQREDALKRREEELKWRDDAIRERERHLNERDAALQEEAQRLEDLSDRLDAREEALAERRSILDQEHDGIQEREAGLVSRVNELEARSAALRVEESEIAHRETQRVEELQFLQSQLEAERLKLQTEEREHQEQDRARIEAKARILIEQRERAVREAQHAEERAQTAAAEVKRLQEEAREIAEKERNTARALYEKELADREANRIAHENAEGAFARTEIRRAKLSEDTPPPDELTHREFELGGVTLRALYCPPGSTWCGSDEEGARPEERPRHRLRINRGFWLMDTPITQAQWSTIMEANPSTHQGLDYPVEGVKWAEAALFCNALSEAFGFEPAYDLDGDLNFSRNRAKMHWRYRAEGFRLPTEAEWEYAARSGLGGQRHIYTRGGDLDDVGWYAQNSGGVTHPVGLKHPNSWGLYDMSGNVWEWCHDEWRKESYRARDTDNTPDPVAYNPQLTPRVIRGGAWYDFASACRVAARPGQDVNQGYGIGFRVCLPHLATLPT